jgi:hypothetical protein
LGTWSTISTSYFSLWKICVLHHTLQKKKWVTTEKKHALKGQGFRNAKYVKKIVTAVLKVIPKMEMFPNVEASLD